MRRLASRMLSRYPAVHRWEETDDVCQESAVRLHRALGELTPVSSRHFYCLAALQVRRVLIDMARQYSGRCSFAANHETHHDGPDRHLKNAAHQEERLETVSLDDWADFHWHVENLPQPHREIFDLVWYSGLRQEEAAEVLGITKRSVQRRWREARVLLAGRRQGERPV